jgi:hypothetical protein
MYMTNYQRWDLPAQGWSRAKYNDENIKLVCENGVWWGQVERNQCVQRDLDDDEIISVRREHEDWITL